MHRVFSMLGTQKFIYTSFHWFCITVELVRFTTPLQRLPFNTVISDDIPINFKAHILKKSIIPKINIFADFGFILAAINEHFASSGQSNFTWGDRPWSTILIIVNFKFQLHFKWFKKVFLRNDSWAILVF